MLFVWSIALFQKVNGKTRSEIYITVLITILNYNNYIIVLALNK